MAASKRAAEAGSQEKGAHRRRELEPADLRTAARAMDEEGDLEAALGYLEEALALDPDDPQTLLYLAQLRHRRLEWQEAIDGYGAVLAEREVEPGDYVLLEYLTLLEEVRKAAPELLPQVHEEVEHLVLRFPEDPLVALARARRELELGPPIPEVRLGRALQRLDEFRVATEYKSLESLLPESTRAWFSFYLEHDPDAAHKLVAAELEKEPAALDLWYMLGESYAALGQKSDAVETFRFLLRMLPDKRTTRSLARLLSESGRDIEEVSELVSQTMHLERSRAKDIDLQLSVARSLANNLASESRDRALGHAPGSVEQAAQRRARPGRGGRDRRALRAVPRVALRGRSCGASPARGRRADRRPGAAAHAARRGQPGAVTTAGLAAHAVTAGLEHLGQRPEAPLGEQAPRGAAACAPGSGSGGSA